MSHTRRKGIEDILFDKNILTADQLSAVRLESVNTGKKVEDIILSRKIASERDLVYAKSVLLNTPVANLDDITVEPSLLATIPELLAKKYTIFPLEQTANILSVAMVDPLDLETIEFLEKRTGFYIKPQIATSADILKTIETQYGRMIGEDVSKAIEEVGVTKLEEQIKDINRVQDVLRDAPVARILSAILEVGVKSKASDIHIEPQESDTRVRFRVDGILQEKLAPLPKSVHDSLVARIKILAGMKIDEKRKPQDGRFKVRVGNEETDLRVSSLPTVEGEKVVIRLLKEEGKIMQLKDLGLRGIALRRFEEALLKPHGIILVTGPTGSGKTVTLATALSKINSLRVNIVTVEDPVEIRIKGVNQVQINPVAGLTFASSLRSFLRQDPNIIMVGEIRDGETAELAIHASLVGRLVLSTLHTNSASGSIPRLIDMGVENFLLSSTLVCVLAQRLVRRVCSYCKEEYDAPIEVSRDIKKVLGELYSGKSGDKIKLSRGRGCEKCNKQGYSGRIGIYEVMPVTDTISKLIIERKTESEIESIAKSEGMVTLVQDGFLKSLEGITTIEEVLMVARS
jgi:type IV pilus assembly protein PilB